LKLGAAAALRVAAAPRALLAWGGSAPHLPSDTTVKRKRVKTNSPAGDGRLPLMLIETGVASLITVGRRYQLIATGRLSAAEATRMVKEKADAAADTAALLGRGRCRVTAAALLAPWHRRVIANARRLNRR
jgi:hypothetical protein